MLTFPREIDPDLNVVKRALLPEYKEEIQQILGVLKEVKDFFRLYLGIREFLTEGVGPGKFAEFSKHVIVEHNYRITKASAKWISELNKYKLVNHAHREARSAAEDKFNYILNAVDKTLKALHNEVRNSIMLEYKAICAKRLEFRPIGSANSKRRSKANPLSP
ncbi:MAG TPA: hypothetical protein HPQ04_15820 [Rhodospirillaceae bacterium]|nr:hypothetical protein [Rhodospirillaceae bacterium]